MIYLDSETCGLVGPMVLLQYAEDDGEIKLHEIFNSRISETLKLIEYICEQHVVGFNLVYDWFHLTKIYNILRVFADNGYTDIPTVNTFLQVEAANPSEYCLKPRAACDLMLHARRGPYQTLMSRKNIVLRKIPVAIAHDLTLLLKEQIVLDPIYFARRKEGYEWQIQECDSKDFVNIVLRWAPSGGLGAICEHALGEKKADFPIPKYIQPTEIDWKPYGDYGSNPVSFVLPKHIALWQSNEQARYYAERDVYLTRKLHKHFGYPKPGDTDSELACAIGAARWRGFAINPTTITQLKDKYRRAKYLYPRAPKPCKSMLYKVLTDEEKSLVKSTRKEMLETIAKWDDHPAKPIAIGILDSRRAERRLELLTKLEQIPALYPDFKVIGTRSNRMSGGSEVKGKKGSINPQAIPRGHEFRDLFAMAFQDEILEGGDAKSYEISIMDGVWKCPALHEELKTGKNFHGLLGAIWYNTSYDDIMGTKSTPNGLYDRAKNTDFAFAYGAQAPKAASTANIEISQAEAALIILGKKFPEIIQRRKQIESMFCSMSQPGGIGSRVIWKDPADYIESIFGFRRYFTLENSIVKALYQIANNLPKEWATGSVVRREDRGSQTYRGAASSSLLAAAFALQAAIMRAACNHEIQSPGGEITKELQRTLNDQQPFGVHKWVIRTFNIHDEILGVQNGTVDTKTIVQNHIKKYRAYIPLLDWEWGKMESWGSK